MGDQPCSPPHAIQILRRPDSTPIGHTPTRRRSLALTAIVAAVLGLALPPVAEASEISSAIPGLVLHEVSPCVLFDTRPSQGGTGILGGGESRTFHVVGSTSDFASQGGTAGGCDIPGFTGGAPHPEMVYLDLAAVEPTGGGNLRIWATGDQEPQGGVVNYQKLTPNLDNSNSVIVGVRQDTEGEDITVRVNVSATHVRGLALGYLTRADQVDASFWALDGNPDIEPDFQFLGTSDDIPFTLGANGAGALRLEPRPSPHPARSSGITVLTDVQYAAPGGFPLFMDIYLPPLAFGASLPAISMPMLHGLENSDRDHPGVAGTARMFADAGYVTYVTQVRTHAPQWGRAPWPAMRDDALASVEWIRQHDTTYDTDPDRIGMFGQTYVAHEVAFYGDDADLTSGGRVRAVASWTTVSQFYSMPVDETNNIVNQFLGFKPIVRDENGEWVENPDLTEAQRTKARDVSPSWHISPNDPPIRVVHSENDSRVFVAQARDMRAQLLAAGRVQGKDFEYREHRGSAHSYSLRAADGAATLAFFARHLAGGSADPPPSPNLIGGHPSNGSSGGVWGVTISGGADNSATDHFGTVSGGSHNRSGYEAGATDSAPYATVGGGMSNAASGAWATVGGGSQNLASFDFATVGGGSLNRADAARALVAGGSLNQATALGATVSGGLSNQASGQLSTAAGGLHNVASGSDSTVGGGLQNQATDSGSTIAGGRDNTADGASATLGGGQQNGASAGGTVAGGFNNIAGNTAAIVGGQGNRATGPGSTIVGGLASIAVGSGAVVGGGSSNEAAGTTAGVPGGRENSAAANHSLAAGRRAKVSSDHDGTFLWADRIGFEFHSAAADEFAARATGGVRFVSGVDGSGVPSAGVILPTGSGSWASLSDRAAKQFLRPVDPAAVLRAATELPIGTWRYRTEADSVLHVGPTAQDFHAAFGLGSDDRHITTVDADGVALAAIQGLHEVVEEQRAEIAHIRAQLASGNGSGPRWGDLWGPVAALAIAALGLSRGKWMRKRPVTQRSPTRSTGRTSPIDAAAQPRRPSHRRKGAVMRRTLALTAVLALVLGLGLAPPAGGTEASSLTPDLVFHEITPCALFDTRPSQGGTGIMAAGESRSFHVVGSASDFAGQGGTRGGCGIPGFSGGSPQTDMVYLNLVAVDPTGGGNLRVWATGDPEPTGGVVNYQKLTPNLNNSNGVIVGVRQDTEGSDITVRANVSGVHVRGVALGYLTQASQGATAWLLGGNAGTDPATNFVGTTDDTPLNLRVNGERVLRLEPGASPNLIGGHSSNSASTGSIGATISGGGGPSGGENRVTDHFGTVSGGSHNRSGDEAGATDSAHYATVGGGMSNAASGAWATVGGGSQNLASFDFATVGGGSLNTADAAWALVAGGRSNTATGDRAVVGGGDTNVASGFAATVAGGGNNVASSTQSTVGGGLLNQASANYSTVAGGRENEAGDTWATVGGGQENTATTGGTVAGGLSNLAGTHAAVGGGQGNMASGPNATIAGGTGNTAGGFLSTVGGGSSNEAAGQRATVPGGEENSAAGDYSLAAGRRAKVGSDHGGTFLWADNSGFDFTSEAANEFAARATGGVRFVSAVDGNGEPSAGVILSPGSGSWASLSDVGAKEGFTPVDPQRILERVAGLDITSWRYLGEDPTVVHLGPTAQDFHAAFGLGPDDRHITTVDADGVALAAIQGLHEVVEEQRAEIAQLRADLTAGDPRSARRAGLPWGTLWGLAAALGLGGLVLSRQAREDGPQTT